jgi:hypothetical protein
MTTRLRRDSKRRAGEKTASLGVAASSYPYTYTSVQVFKQDLSAAEFKYYTVGLLPYLQPAADVQGVVLWDEAVESLGRSARILQELAESTGAAVARIAAQGDRIDRIQIETRALLNALVAAEADA